MYIECACLVWDNNYTAGISIIDFESVYNDNDFIFQTKICSFFLNITNSITLTMSDKKSKYAF